MDKSELKSKGNRLSSQVSESKKK